MSAEQIPSLADLIGVFESAEADPTPMARRVTLQDLERIVAVSQAALAARQAELLAFAHFVSKAKGEQQAAPEWLCTGDAAKLAGTTKATVRQWARDRKIVSRAAGDARNASKQILRASLESFLNAGLAGAASP
jgi:hypothetical protein